MNRTPKKSTFRILTRALIEDKKKHDIEQK
jgi:hypothetical protein